MLGISPKNSNLSAHRLKVAIGSSNWTDVVYWSCKIGTVVYLNIRFTSTASYTSSSTLVTIKYSDNTPVAPAYDDTNVSQAPRFVAMVGSTPYVFFVNANGQIHPLGPVQAGTHTISCVFDTGNYKF